MPTHFRLAVAMLTAMLTVACANEPADPAEEADETAADVEAPEALDADQDDGADPLPDDADEPDPLEIDSPEPVEFEAGTYVLLKGGHERPVAVTLDEPTMVSALANDQRTVAGAIVFEREDMLVGLIEPSEMVAYEDGEYDYVPVPDDLPAWLESDEGATRHVHYQQIDGITVEGYDDQFVAVAHASAEWSERYEGERLVQQVDDPGSDGGFVSGYEPDGSTYVILYLLDGDRWLFVGGKDDSTPLIAELLGIGTDLQDEVNALEHDGT
jgi:hypothetical protein